jgi:hypothetical protein
MLKVPTYQCSFDHARTTRVKFLGKHEVPLFRANTRLQAGASELLVERPHGGQDAAIYWTSFPSVEDEYARLKQVYTVLVDQTYTTIDDLREVIESELERVAGNRGTNPNAPKEIVADPSIVALVKKSIELAADASDEDAAKYKAEVNEIAVSLARIGMLTVDEIAATALSTLCTAPRVTPQLAGDLRTHARAQVARNAELDAEKGQGSLDLGALAGHTMEG